MEHGLKYKTKAFMKNTGGNLWDLGQGTKFLQLTSKAGFMKRNLDTLYLIAMKTVDSEKDPVRRKSRSQRL